jgi:thiamine-phosphate pyrophosphorylase
VHERLLILTDRRACGGDLVDTVARALASLPAGAALVQVREKDLDGRTLVRLVRQLVAAGARVVVNDRADVAVSAGAHGVHLPENGMTVAEARAVIGPGGLVGASVHDVAGASRRAGADYLLVGPIWDSPGKIACGLGVLSAIVGAAGVPVFAVGGIDGRERARAARAAGAHGVAAIRAIVGAADPGRAAAELLA